MSHRVFLISDTHFGHKNILGFKREDGSPLRDFPSTHDMDMTMVENWNRVVRPVDKVYHLGDVAFTDGGIRLLGMLNGHKRLMRGNHDLYKMRFYNEHFEEVYGVRQIDGFWLTHVPMHPDAVASPRVKANIHGHLHANRVKGNFSSKYFNVSVECINYTPIDFEEIKEFYKT